MAGSAAALALVALPDASVAPDRSSVLTADNSSAAAASVTVAALGVWLVRRVPVERLYAIIYALLILVGLKLSADGLAGLL